jgi:predicted nucleotidyltransferase
MFEQILERVALGLEDRQIPYMVIGGQAVLLYGEPRLTRDIDITLGVGPERLQVILDLVKGWGWSVLPESPIAFVEKTMVLPCLEAASGIRVDFIFSFSAFERQAMDRVQRVALGNAQVRFASVEDVIIHKIVAGRPRDLEDVRGVLLKRPAIDLAYVHRWLQEFDQSLGERFRHRFEELRQSIPTT